MKVSKGVYKFTLNPRLKNSVVKVNVSSQYNIKTYGKSEEQLLLFSNSALGAVGCEVSVPTAHKPLGMGQYDFKKQ